MIMNKSFAKVTLIFFALSFTLASCGGSFYEKHEGIKNLIWDIKDVKKFTVDVKDNKANYKLNLAIRYASGVQRTKTVAYTLKVTTTAPSGKKTVKDYKINLKDDKGEFLGEPLGDIIDLMTLVEPDYTFAETGKYTFEVIHNMPPNTSITGIMEAGLKIDKVETK